MTKKKKSIKRQKNWLESAKKLIKTKPREFVTGLLTLSLVLSMLVFLILSSYSPKNYWPKSGKSQPEVTVIQPSPRFHIMQEGESLWDVANREYNNPYLYPTLVELNNLSSPDVVEPGMKIRVR